MSYRIKAVRSGRARHFDTAVRSVSKDKMNDRVDYLATTGMHGKWDQGPLGRIDSDGEIGTLAERQAHKRKTVVETALTKLRTAGIDIDNRD